MENGQRDYCKIAKEYARQATLLKNQAKFGKWIKLAAKRFTGDLQKTKKSDCHYYFDTWNANDACGFIERLPHVEGKWETPTITLHKSDVFFIVNLFGFRNKDGSRRFTTALKAIARKNAKSTVAAAIALYCQVCEGEDGAQVISGATTGQQARIVFSVAKRMVEKTAALREAFGMEAFAHAISSQSNGGSFKPINAKASTQDGLNPSCVVLDELHAHKDGDLLNVLQSASGARKNPLFLFTTTEGYESPGPWAEVRHFAKQVLEGVIEADHFLAVYYAIDDEDDDFDESKWIKANPLIEVNPILLTEMRKQAIEAKAMPGKLAEFRIKRLNRQSSSAQGWIKFDKWKTCATPVDLELLKGYPCWGGLDLASTSDLTSFRLVWDVEGHLYTWGKRWVPESAVKNRTIRGTVPYQAWVAGHFLTVTPGDVTDYAYVEKEILEACENFNVQAIAYDQWNAAQLTSKLKTQDVPLQMFIQGPKSYHPAMQAFERAYISEKLSYGIDPVLTWCASNLVTRTDANLNMAPDKKRSSEKIDDMVALLMAVGISQSEPEEESSIYETPGFSLFG